MSCADYLAYITHQQVIRLLTGILQEATDLPSYPEMGGGRIVVDTVDEHILRQLKVDIITPGDAEDDPNTLMFDVMVSLFDLRDLGRSWNFNRFSTFPDMLRDVTELWGEAETEARRMASQHVEGHVS